MREARQQHEPIHGCSMRVIEPPPNRPRQEEQCRMEQRQPAERQQDEEIAVTQ